MADQVSEDFEGAGRLEVEGDAVLPGDRLRVASDMSADRAWSGSAGLRRNREDSTGRVTDLGVLDLDDGRSEASQQPGRTGPGERARQVDDDESIEGFGTLSHRAADFELSSSYRVRRVPPPEDRHHAPQHAVVGRTRRRSSIDRPRSGHWPDEWHRGFVDEMTSPAPPPRRHPGLGHQIQAGEQLSGAHDRMLIDTTTGSDQFDGGNFATQLGSSLVLIQPMHEHLGLILFEYQLHECRGVEVVV